jgi:hypothetical protein
MAIADPNSPNTAVRVQPGDTLSAIAKANGLTLAEIKALNPALTSNPKYNNGNTIFSNTKINIAPPEAKAAVVPPPTPAPENPPLTTPNITPPPDPAPTPQPDPTPISIPDTTPSPVFAPQPTPSYSPSYSTPTPTPAIKTATPQFILFNDDEVPVDAIVDLLFENIGGQELLSIGRSDTINGQKILYQPIKNLNILKEQYNPNNIIRLQNTSDKFFNSFSIKLADKIPVVGNGSNGSNVYLDPSGNLVIEFINLSDEEQAEIEITSSGIINEVGI